MEPDRRVPYINDFALIGIVTQMNEITFSVVVPTHNRSDLLATLFDTLAIAKAEFSGQVETIIVDSSSGIEAHAIQFLCEKYSAHYLSCTNRVTRKRNLGVQEATGEYIFFTDSDCELSKDVFVQHLLTYETYGKNTGGVLGLTLVCGDTAPIWRSLHLDSSFTTSFSFARWMEIAPWGTCTNLSFRTEVLKKVGGFDEDWPLVVYGEDVDLGMRFNQAGYEIRCNRQAVVRHNSATIHGTTQVLRKKFLTGRADYHLGKKHPDRVALEFPGWTAFGLILLPVFIWKSLTEQYLDPLLLFAAAISLGILFQAFLTAKSSKTGQQDIFRYAFVIIFEAVFEFGKICESFRNGHIRRMWTKFVYVDRQLLGERDKRIRQMWSFIFSLLFLVAFSGIHIFG